MRKLKSEEKERIVRSYNFTPKTINIIDDVCATRRIDKTKFVEEAIAAHAQAKYGVGKNIEKTDNEIKIEFLFETLFPPNTVKREFLGIKISDDEETQNIFEEILNLYKKNKHYVESLNITAALGSNYKRLKESFSERDLYIIALAIKYDIHKFPQS